MLGPRPSPATPPSIWYHAVAVPQTKSAGRRAGVVMGLLGMGESGSLEVQPVLTRRTQVLQRVEQGVRQRDAHSGDQRVQPLRLAEPDDRGADPRVADGGL